MIPGGPVDRRRTRRGHAGRAPTGPIGALVLVLAVAAVGLTAHVPCAAFDLPEDSLGVTLEAVPLNGTAPLIVWFHASTTPSVPAGFAWTFGDGAGWNQTGVNASTVTHEYSAAGTFLARVTVATGNATASTSVTVTVSSVPLAVTIQASTGQGYAPLTVDFAGTPSGGSGTYPEFTWTFGDGGIGSGPAVEYTYVRAGQFTANLTVRDSANRSATASVDVVVAPNSAATPSGSGAAAWPWWWGVLPLVAVGGGLAALGLRHRVSGAAAIGPAPEGPEALPAASRAPGSVPEPVPAAPIGPAPSSRPSTAEDPSRRDSSGTALAPRILLRLYGLGVLRADEVARSERTQSGLASDLGLRQTAVSRVLRSLIAGGVVEGATRHVHGRSRRVKVYFLSPAGEQLAKDLRVARARANRPPGPFEDPRPGPAEENPDTRRVP